jgi:lysosomal Pro-X carboxypeptidase
MVMPFASNKTTSMFPPSNWDDKTNTAYCEAAYSLRP